MARKHRWQYHDFARKAHNDEFLLRPQCYQDNDLCRSQSGRSQDVVVELGHEMRRLSQVETARVAYNFTARVIAQASISLLCHKSQIMILRRHLTTHFLA